MTPRVHRFIPALAGFIIVILVAAPQARQAPGFVPAGVVTAGPTDSAVIDLLVGRSTVLNIGSPITRVSLTVPDIADAMVTGPAQLLIHGKQPGTISMFVWERGGSIKTYEVIVRRDLTALTEQYKSLFPGETISVAGSGKDVVISGTVTSQYVIDKAADVAGGYVEKKENVVNLLKQQEGVASNQVMLRVRFAEVSRSAMQELGASYFANGYKQEWSGRIATPGVPSPDFDPDKGLVFSDFLNLFVFNSKEGLGAVVRALSNKGLFQSLAEPNLIATNGKEASFLAGGEYPYPVVQASNGSNSVTISFKEFGVRLSFTPTVLGGDLLHIKVKPEVSSLDFANAVRGERLPHPGALDAPHRDRGGAARRADVRDRRIDEQHADEHDGEDPGHRRHPDPRQAVPEQGAPEEPDRARRDDHALDHPPRADGRVGRPAVARRAVSRPSRQGRCRALTPYVGSPRYPVAPGAKRPSTGQDPVPAPSAQPGAPSQPPAPVTRPIQGTAALPQVPAPAPVTPAAQPRPQPAAPVVQQPAAPVVQQPAAPVVQQPVAPVVRKPAAPPKPTKAELKALEQQHEAELKAAAAAAKQKAADDKQKAADAKRKAEAQKAAQKKADEDKRAADKLSKERATREAAVAKKNAESARQKAEADQKRERALADAAARLKQAQAAYQAEIERAKGGTSEKAKGPGKDVPAPDSRD